VDGGIKGDSVQTILQNEGDVIYVLLGDSDLARAMDIAQKRFEFYGGDNYRGAEFQDEKFDIALHNIGAASELGTALALGIPWTGDIKQDVGPYEVKAVTEPHHRLFIPQKDRHRYSPRFKARVYISVENIAMTPARFLQDWRVRGWAYAGDFYGKDDCLEYLMNEQRAPVYALPNKLLRPMNTLPRTAPE
jgi:hypothetical protein